MTHGFDSALPTAMCKKKQQLTIPIKNSLDKLPPILKENLDRNLCVCNELLKMDVINAIVNGATTVEDIKKQTYATDGNGCCTQQVERLIECLCSPEAEK
jgi:NAD(P)H-nitrite reductase large subunit